MRTGTTILLILIFTSHLSAQRVPEIGIAQPMEKDSLLSAAGYRYLVESISRNFSPRNVNDAQFQEKLTTFNKLKIKLYACNLFIPGEMKLVGPNVDEEAVLSYCRTVFERCQKAGLKLIVWGSGGARQIPEGFDRNAARTQFISIAVKIADLAARHGVVLAIENLNSKETNFITTLSEAYEIVKEVNKPALRLCVDIYHMMKEDESPAVIEKAAKYVVHCDLAEKEKRTPPGTAGDDFRAHFAALKKIKYKGKIIMECSWENLVVQLVPARLALQKQLEDVWLK